MVHFHRVIKEGKRLDHHTHVPAAWKKRNFYINLSDAKKKEKETTEEEGGSSSQGAPKKKKKGVSAHSEGGRASCSPHMVGKTSRLKKKKIH